MRVKIRFPFAIVKTDHSQRINASLRSIELAEKSALAEIKKMIDSARKDIVCVVCGKNVYWNYGYWVHGNKGNAYCLDCWRKEGLDKPKSKR